MYIREAHPSDIWQMRSNLREGVIFRDPRSEQERVEVAESCVRKLGIRFPALVDGIDRLQERTRPVWLRSRAPGSRAADLCEVGRYGPSGICLCFSIPFQREKSDVVRAVSDTRPEIEAVRR